MENLKYPKVNILLSAYNGERYIREQIDSLMNQSYPNIDIYIRDDGSKDSTRMVLERYSSDNRFHIEYGENVGFIKSFFSLLSTCSEADYYAFCDQDDVWFPDKVSRAVEKLSGSDSSKPILYFTSYDYYDENLSFLSHPQPPENIGFPNCLVDCVSLGFNSVINSVAREMICRSLPQHSCGHDWWAYMVCAGMGQVVFDNYPSTKYRRCGNNVSNGGAGFLEFQIWRFKKFFIGEYFKNITAQLCEYEAQYSDMLSLDRRKILSLFTKKTFSNGLRKFFFPRMLRQNLIDEIFLRICFMLGRL